MNKVIRFFYVCFLFAIPIAILWTIVFFVVEDNKKNQYVCIEDYMYMRVEGSLLAYPNSFDHQTCSVFEYNLKNKAEIQ